MLMLLNKTVNLAPLVITMETGSRNDRDSDMVLVTTALIFARAIEILLAAASETVVF